jgi:hypothetical protein
MADDNDVVRHRGLARDGRAGSKGREFEPAEIGPEAEGPGYELLDRPRPAKSRFPIDLATFTALKDAAVSTRHRGTLDSTITQDKGRRRVVRAVEAALEVMSAAAPGEAAAAAAPAGGVNFQGIAATGWIPPDCTLAAGPEHVLVAVNASVHVYAKTGGAPLLQRTLNAWFQNVMPTAKIFDPKALWDQHAGRWVLVAAALGIGQDRSWFLVSVSKTANPLGGWWNFALDAMLDGGKATNNWGDYPAVGVDTGSLYLTANMFRFGGSFQYAKIRILPKNPLYSGGTPTWKDFVGMRNADGTMAFTLQPCHTYGAPGTQYFVNSEFPASTAAPTRRNLSLWSLSPAGALTRRTVATDPYGLPPDASQKGGGMALDTGDIRLLNAVFRGGSVFTALNTFHDWGDGNNVAAVHWFQLNATSGSIVQQGIYGAKGLNYFYPAVMPDTNGNLALVFCRCGAAEFAGVYYTGRLATDPPGKLVPSTLLKAGAATYVRTDGVGRNRWGDYAGIGADPAVPRQIWFYGMYAAAPNTWGTWVGSEHF